MIFLLSCNDESTKPTVFLPLNIKEDKQDVLRPMKYRSSKVSFSDKEEVIKPGRDTKHLEMQIIY